MVDYEEYTEDGYTARRLYSIMMKDPDHPHAEAYDYMNSRVHRYGIQKRDYKKADEMFDKLLSDECSQEETEALICELDFSAYNHQEMIEFVEDIRNLGI